MRQRKCVAGESSNGRTHVSANGSARSRLHWARWISQPWSVRHWKTERTVTGQDGSVPRPGAGAIRSLNAHGCKPCLNKEENTMALKANGQRFCKVVHTENGRTWTRRIHSIMVQAANGQLHYLEGANLPDSMSLYSGVPFSGAHMAEVLLSPKEAKGTPFLPVAKGWLTKRDAFFVMLGMFSFGLIITLTERVAQVLT